MFRPEWLNILGITLFTLILSGNSAWADTGKLNCNVSYQTSSSTGTFQLPFDLNFSEDDLSVANTQWYDLDYDSPNYFNGFFEISASVCLDPEICRPDNLYIGLAHRYYDQISKDYKTVAELENRLVLTNINQPIHIALTSNWEGPKIFTVDCTVSRP